MGSLPENSVYNNLRKNVEIKYYQRRSGVEADFVLPQHSMALEVKSTGSAHDLQKLEKLARSKGLNHYFVITHNFSSLDGIIPASMI